MQRQGQSLLRLLCCCQAGRHGVELRLMTKRRVGIKLPSVEVRFEDLTVEAQAEAAGRELPSIFNSYRNWVEVGPLELNWHLTSLCNCLSQGMCENQVQAGQLYPYDGHERRKNDERTMRPT